MEDATALNLLARVVKKAGPDGDLEEGGEDIANILCRLLKETGRSLEYTQATPANMRKFQEQDPEEFDGVLPQCLAISIHVADEDASGDPQDYPDLAADEPVTDSLDEPMILVAKRTEYVDALTWEGI